MHGSEKHFELVTCTTIFVARQVSCCTAFLNKSMPVGVLFWNDTQLGIVHEPSWRILIWIQKGRFQVCIILYCTLYRLLLLFYNCTRFFQCGHGGSMSSPSCSILLVLLQTSSRIVWYRDKDYSPNRLQGIRNGFPNINTNIQYTPLLHPYICKPTQDGV